MTVAAFIAPFAVVQPSLAQDDAPVAQQTHSEAQRAIAAGHAAFENEDWQGAIDQYHKAISLGIDHHAMRMRLGYALHMQGKYEEAMPNHLRAASATHKEIRVDGLYNCACALARLGEKAQALEFLAKAIDAGFRDASQLVKDGDMDSLRDDERFKALAAGIGVQPVLGEWMNFIIGDWEQRETDGTVVESLRVQRPLAGSHGLVTVNTNICGGQWTGMLWPDSESRTWRWAACDGIGTSRVFIGEKSVDGAMVFSGTDQSPVGPTLHMRLTYRRLENGHVQETVESSVDGVEWRNHGQQRYVPRASSAPGE